jgi:hypothetical protein
MRARLQLLQRQLEYGREQRANAVGRHEARTEEHAARLVRVRVGVRVGVGVGVGVGVRAMARARVRVQVCSTPHAMYLVQMHLLGVAQLQTLRRRLHAAALLRRPAA